MVNEKRESNANNEFLLDGVPNNANQGGNNIAYVPPAEAVQEMKVSTNSYNAQYSRERRRRGQHVAEVGHQLVPRRRLRLHAAQGAGRQLVPAQFAPVAEDRSVPSNRSGFSVDGPIWKNKTFFLFTGENYREGTPAPLFSTVPTPAMKNGDFSGLVDASGRPDGHLQSRDRP